VLSLNRAITPFSLSLALTRNEITSKIGFVSCQ
jgi:hypothetical protein